MNKHWMTTAMTVIPLLSLLLVGCAGGPPPETEATDDLTTIEEVDTGGGFSAVPEPIAPAPAPTPRPAAESDTTARLGVGDVLEIDVFGLDELDRKVRVQEDGTISMPLLGKIRVEGLSLTAAEELVASMLSSAKLVNNPEVSIFVEEFASRGVSVQGAVNNPGIYQILGNRSLLDLIGEAGGFSPGRGSSLYLLRKIGGGSEHRFEIDIDRLIEGRDRALNMFLEPGDLVMVPQARTQRVYVTGAVASPGAIEFSSGEGITLLQAITAAGGPTERANLRKVSVTRRLDDGSQERWQLNVKAIQKGKADDFVLEGNDTIVVREWLF